MVLPTSFSKLLSIPSGMVFNTFSFPLSTHTVTYIQKQRSVSYVFLSLCTVAL